MSKIQKSVLGVILLASIGSISQDIPFKIFSASAQNIQLNKEVIIFDQGLEYKIQSKGETIKKVLTNANIKIHKNDIIFPSLDYKIDEDQYPIKIIIERAVPVSLDIYGKTKKIFTRQEKVIEVLEEEGIDFKNDDLINYNFNEEIFPGIEIKIWKKPKPKPKPAPKPIKIIKTGEIQTGIASWYSYIPGNFCASTTYRKGTKLLVTNLSNGKKVIVTVNDYGPFSGPIIDLEKNAFLKLAPLWKGVIRVKVEKVRVH